MNFCVFYCLIMRSQSRMILNITRYECDFTINVPVIQKLLLPIETPYHLDSSITRVDPLRVYLDILKGRSQIHFLEHVCNQTSVTIRLHLEKKRVEDALQWTTKSTPICNGERVKAAVIRSFDDYELIISSKTIPLYVAIKHPEDCKHNEIGYPNSDTCYEQGNLCIALKTGVKKCRCQAGYIGTYCNQLLY